MFDYGGIANGNNAKSVLDFRDFVVDVRSELRASGGGDRRWRAAWLQQSNSIVSHPHAVEMQHEHGRRLNTCLKIQAHMQILPRRVHVEHFSAEIHAGWQIRDRHRDA